MQYEQVELQPIEICTHAWKRRSRCAGRSPANESHCPKPAAWRDAAGADPVGEVRDRTGPEGDVDVRVELEEAVALRLGVAAADRDHLVRVALLERRRLREVGGEALVGLLADRARVEHEHVRLDLVGRLAEPDRLEHPLDPLGVVSVHLAPERGDVVALHGEGIVETP